jgi:hypothetical protein
MQRVLTLDLWLMQAKGGAEMSMTTLFGRCLDRVSRHDVN